MVATPSKPRCFTLIELLVVLTLISIMAGMTVVRLDGLSGSARLRAAVWQHRSVIKLAQMQAQTTGEPRLVEYADSRILLRRPKKSLGNWQWDEGMQFDLPSGVRLKGILEQEDDDVVHSQAIRVSSDGRVSPHGAMFAVSQQSVVGLYHNLEDPQIRFFEKEPQVSSWPMFIALFEASHEKP